MNKRVLFIENDHDIRQIVDFILQEHGFETLSIPEPVEVSELIGFNADVMLLDEFINSKQGRRLALAATPVIILSTSHDIELIVKECEANDYICKPFDVEYLVDKVIQVLNRQPLSL